MERVIFTPGSNRIKMPFHFIKKFKRMTPQERVKVLWKIGVPVRPGQRIRNRRNKRTIKGSSMKIKYIVNYIPERWNAKKV